MTETEKSMPTRPRRVRNVAQWDIETDVAIATGKLHTLSPQQIVSCDKKDDGAVDAKGIDDDMDSCDEDVSSLAVVGYVCRYCCLYFINIKHPFGVGKVITVSSYRFEMLSADAFTEAWTKAYEGGYEFVDPRPKMSIEGKESKK